MEVDTGDISSSLIEHEFSIRRQRLEEGMPIDQVREPVPLRTGFCYNLCKNFRIIGRAMTFKEIYFVVIFFIAKGILMPTFEEFTYFFLMNEIKISKFVFALLVLLG